MLLPMGEEDNDTIGEKISVDEEDSKAIWMGGEDNNTIGEEV